MLVKGQIPDKEPIVSIGLILPEDCQKSVEITNSEINQNFLIESKNDELVYNGETVPAVKIKNSSTDSQITVHPVKAGRGFHWEKQISIHVLGTLEITNSNGSLFVVNHLPLEQYLMCVATSEMSGDCPSAFLEAQTIAARSWLLAAAEQKHVDLGLDACNDDCCQRYQGAGNLTKAAIQSAEKTCGQVLIHDNAICDTRYSKSCGGISENNENVWRDVPKPYLRSVYDSNVSEIPCIDNETDLINWLSNNPHCFCGPDFVPKSQLHKYLGIVDEQGSYFRWEISFSQEELKNMIKVKTGRDFDAIHSIQPLKRGKSGRIFRLRIDGEIDGKSNHIILESEYEIRRVLHPDFLYSSAFIIEPNSNFVNSQVTFNGAGWGHGVGLCQIGALGMALADYSSNEILYHYFQSTELRKIYG